MRSVRVKMEARALLEREIFLSYHAVIIEILGPLPDLQGWKDKMIKQWTEMERKVRSIQQLCLNTFLVEFDRFEDRAKIIEEGPWLEDKSVCIPSEWKKEKTPSFLLSN
eukprot:c18574_g1_i1 orf=83-409(+)